MRARAVGVMLAAIVFGTGASPPHAGSGAGVEVTKVAPGVSFASPGGWFVDMELDGPLVWEAFPGVCGLVDPTDPTASASALSNAGFAVSWLYTEQIGAPFQLVERPPPGAHIVSVAAGTGSLRLPADTAARAAVGRRLAVEVTHDMSHAPRSACDSPPAPPGN